MSDGTLAYDIAADATQFKGEIRQVEAVVGKLHSQLMGLAGIAFGPLVAGFAALGAIGDVAYGTKLAAEGEKSRVAFKNLIGDAEEAKRVLAELRAYSDITPFRMGELKAAASTLIASGVSAKDLKDEISVLGNVAAATGGDLAELARIYGQIKGRGHLDERGTNEFINQGAGEVKAQLARTLHVSTEELAKLQEKGVITFAMLKQAMNDLAGTTGKWGNATAELGQTTMGLWSTLEDKVRSLNSALGEPINTAIKPVLSQLTALAERLKPVMTDVGGSIAGMITAMDNFLAHTGKGTGLIAEMGAALKDMFATAADYAGIVFQGLGIVVVGIGRALLEAVTPAGQVLGHLFMEAGYKLKAQLYNLMAELPFLNEGQQALYHSKAGAATADSQMSALQGENAWKDGHGMKNAEATLAEIPDRFNELLETGFKSAKKRSADREWDRTAPGRAKELEEEKERAETMKKIRDRKASRREANSTAIALGLDMVPGDVPDDPFKGKPVKKVKAAEKPNLDLNAHHIDDAAEKLFIRGDEAAGIALMQLAKKALTAGDAVKAKSLVDKASKTDLPGGVDAARSLYNFSQQAGAANDTELQDKLVEMARKAYEAGGKIETGGHKAATGANNMMNSLNAAANTMTGGGRAGGGGHAAGGTGGGQAWKAQGWKAPPIVGANSGGTYRVGTHVVGTPYEAIGAGYHPIGEGYQPGGAGYHPIGEGYQSGGASESRNAVYDPANHSNSAVYDPAKHVHGAAAAAFTGAMLNQRGNELFQPRGGAVAQNGKPQAETTDSAMKTLLQSINREISGVNSKMQNLNMA